MDIHCTPYCCQRGFNNAKCLCIISGLKVSVLFGPFQLGCGLYSRGRKFGTCFALLYYESLHGRMVML